MGGVRKMILLPMFSTIEADGGWIKKVQKCAKVIKGWSLGTIGNLKGFF